MRKTVCVLIVLTMNFTSGQENDSKLNQSYLMQQYFGEWYNGDGLDADQASDTPSLKIVVKPKIKGKSCFVEVFQKKENLWETILVEVISYDAITDQITALGTNAKGETFVGKGGFSSYQDLLMIDTDFNGDLVQKVGFLFEDTGRLVLRGDVVEGDNWEGVYFKKNTLDKNIGIHLVSVKDDMEKDPMRTVKAIAEMGYEYVETHVYKDGGFYGMEPEEFKDLLEKNGMRFEGSMVFKDLDLSNREETMKWWDKCIDDHLKAGIKYLTTTNINIGLLKQKNGLKKYVEYFNAIGRKCKEQGIDFMYHNHMDEFQKIENVVIYDYLLEHTDPKLVSFQSDLYWMRRSKVDPVGYFKKYPGRFAAWHVKDDKELGASGLVDFEEIYEYAELAGLKYNIVEVEAYNYPPLVSVRMAMEYMTIKDFVKKYE